MTINLRITQGGQVHVLYSLAMFSLILYFYKLLP